MARYRLDTLDQLARQMQFAPHEVRAAQIARAEMLLTSLETAKAYPLDFVIYRITDYRPKKTAQELLTGLALQHDLGLLIEQVSASLNVRADALAEPVLSIDDVCEKFNVTSKTIQRWRRKGLSARRFLFADGRQRVGFLLSSVERFLASHRQQAAAVNVSQIDQRETQLILRHALRLANRCSMDEITRRVARRFARSSLTILHTIRKHDREHPQQAIEPQAQPLPTEPQRTSILKSWRQGMSLPELAERSALPRIAVYRAIIDHRMDRLVRRKTRFCDDPLYHQSDAAAAIAAILAQEELAPPPGREDQRLPRDLPPYLQDLYRTPLLTPARERALFLKFNFHKYQFVQARRRIEPELVRHRQLQLLEHHLAKAQETKNAIVRANLRLVVSVARKHVRPGAGLMELVSDGNLTLMRAVEGFDIARGHRFSTYATLALMKGFARSVPQMLAGRSPAAADQDRLAQIPDARPALAATSFIQRDEVRQLLSHLNGRERSILCAHYGLDEDQPATYQQLGQRLGLSKERVRQIERAALAKLRAGAVLH
jgi:RNA polymerase sigma factor (sigma-70 family)